MILKVFSNINDSMILRFKSDPIQHLFFHIYVQIVEQIGTRYLFRVYHSFLQNM